MREVQATEAKARLSELLRSVELGESIVITRHGTAVAHLVPAHSAGSRGPGGGRGSIPTAPGQLGSR